MCSGQEEARAGQDGVSIHYYIFVQIMMRAVLRGFVSQQHADFVRKGLWYGFDLGVDLDKMRGIKRSHRNYPSAYQAREANTRDS